MNRKISDISQSPSGNNRGVEFYFKIVYDEFLPVRRVLTHIIFEQIVNVIT
jgi:hypothetical protein